MNHRFISVVIPVFRDAHRASQAAVAMRCQQVSGVDVQVIIVDDGSGDGTIDTLRSLALPGIDLLALPSNQGRSAARNAGAHAARGDVIVFMDSDCLPVEPGFLAAHHAAFLDESVVAGTGHVTGPDHGFWSRYQTEASARRAQQHARGDVYAGSSQNLSVHRSTFESIGGFDAQYKEYGFEDRDLLIRMAAMGRVAWVPGATVTHCDELKLSQISRKMIRAGMHSADRFSHLHAEQYRSLGYAAIDARLHPAFRIVSWAFRPLLPSMARAVDWCVMRSISPYPLAALMTKAIIGLSFMVGTTNNPANPSAPP